MKTNKLVRNIAYIGIISALVISIKQITFTFPLIGKLDFSLIVIVISGFTLGPFIGGLVGFIGDFLGGIFKGWPPLPIIFPWGTMIVGVLAGYLGKFNNNKVKTLANVIILFLLTNFVIDFITYAIYFAIIGTKFKTITMAATIYFPIRAAKTFVLLPIWILVIPRITKTIKK